jgi:hypothetical protein
MATENSEFITGNISGISSNGTGNPRLKSSNYNNTPELQVPKMVPEEYRNATIGLAVALFVAIVGLIVFAVLWGISNSSSNTLSTDQPIKSLSDNPQGDEKMIYKLPSNSELNESFRKSPEKKIFSSMKSFKGKKDEYFETAPDSPVQMLDNPEEELGQPIDQIFSDADDEAEEDLEAISMMDQKQTRNKPNLDPFLSQESALKAAESLTRSVMTNNISRK